jgi:hypothetical protein
VYSGLVASVVVLSVCSVMFFFTVCMRASIKLHNSMFSNITRATMWFFNSNSSGIIDMLGYILTCFFMSIIFMNVWFEWKGILKCCPYI